MNTVWGSTSHYSRWVVDTAPLKGECQVNSYPAPGVKRDATRALTLPFGRYVARG